MANEREKKIIQYLNERCGKKFRPVQAHLQFIRARFRDGYTEEEFKQVIDNRREYWLEDHKMKEFLRPDTLFRPGNFDKYLNAPPYEVVDRQDRELKEWRSK